MESKLGEFVLNFFKKLGCQISCDDGIYLVSNVPRSFEDCYGKVAPYKVTFDNTKEGEIISSGSPIVRAINNYLESAGKTTLLKIDFNVDPLERIKKVFSFKNCEIDSIVKKHKNRFFSRFSFLSEFQYTNEKEQVFNEVYIYNGKVVDGDLSGYKVVEGSDVKFDRDEVKGDYGVAVNCLKALLGDKKRAIVSNIGDLLEKEIFRINEHYDVQLSELGGDLNKQLSRMGELELELRTCEDSDRSEVRGKIQRIHKMLSKKGDDDAKTKILKEKEFTLRDAQQKFSLAVGNKLINTTMIYYPVFVFKIFLKNGDTKRFLELTFDPLTEDVEGFNCEDCGSPLDNVLLCSSGHIVCDSCLFRCSECGDQYCSRCLKHSCDSCARPLCKNCSKVCRGCGKHFCSTHMRTDCVTGEDRCMNCLKACLRCHGVTEGKYFGESSDGSKICQRCLAEENRDKVMTRIFER